MCITIVTAVAMVTMFTTVATVPLFCLILNSEDMEETSCMVAQKIQLKPKWEDVFLLGLSP